MHERLKALPLRLKILSKYLFISALAFLLLLSGCAAKPAPTVRVPAEPAAKNTQVEASSDSLHVTGTPVDVNKVQ